MKNMLKTILKILLVLIILVVMSVVGIVGATLYKRLEADIRENNGNENILVDTEVEEEECITCLFMGVNGHLTDFIMLGQYDPNTRDISLLSIPRDTNVNNSVDGKINSLYMGKYPQKVMDKVEEITGVEVQHYLVFDAKILREVVDEIGGVKVNVPINMNYDDPYQNLYIHLKKGEQVLSGKQAEQFVRFRKNNDGTGYPNGDVGRIAAQQQFIKAMAGEVLSAKNLPKVGNLVKIVLDNTKTDITMELVSKYIDDAVTLRTDRIEIQTLPGEGRYGPSPFGYDLSYYFHDEEETKALVEELFNKKSENISADNSSTEVLSELEHGSKVRLEVLNAGNNMTVLNKVVEALNAGDFDVVKIGNYPTTKNESSRIIDYGMGTADELAELKESLNIKNVETSNDTSNVKYTVIIGTNYKK